VYFNFDPPYWEILTEVEHSFTDLLLPQAAYFGKGFLSGYDVNEYVRISRVLRVLNNIRHPSVGIPLTYTQ
jgi:vacuolar protein sorting-associated protein 16